MELPIEDIYEAKQELFERINNLFLSDKGNFKEELVKLHPADIADFIENINYNQQNEVIALLGVNFPSKAILDFGSYLITQVFNILGVKIFSNILEKLERDEVIEIIESFNEATQNLILAEFSEKKRLDILEGLSYPENSVGRIMDKVIITCSDNLTLKETLIKIQQSNLPESLYSLIVVDKKDKPVGTLDLVSLIKYSPEILVKDIMQTDIKLVAPNNDFEELIYIYRKYSVNIVPVVNKSGKLIASISLKNMLHIIDKEAESDIMHLGGVNEQDIFYKYLETAKHRFPWLFINLITASITSIVISMFDTTIEKMVYLAVIMPIVVSLGSNAATQTITILVRALTTKEIPYHNSYKIILKESIVCGLNGLIIALIGGAIVLGLYSNFYLSVIFAISVFINCIFAGLLGSAIPILLDKYDIDPALSSSVLVTFITDTLGFLTIFFLAYLFFT